MNFGECYRRIRYSLSDESGVLRFTRFNIIDAPDCRGITANLREYLIGRAVADVDLAYLRQLTCAGNGECMLSVIRVVEECQVLFAG